MQVLVDTNVILRFILDDDPVGSPRASELFHKAEAHELELLVMTEVTAECCFVLTSVYELDRQTVSRQLVKLLGLPGVRGEEEDAQMLALEYFATTKLHAVDCLLLARAKLSSLGLATFDKALRKAAGGAVVG